MGTDSVGVMVLISQEPGDALMIEEKVLLNLRTFEVDGLLLSFG